jgi:Sigma-70 region 2
MDSFDDRKAAAFARLAEPALLRLAEQGSVGAINELFLRYYKDIRSLVASLAWGASLQPLDVDDAQQQAFLAVRRAIPRYSPVCGDPPRPCTLRTFLHNAVTKGFHNDRRSERRRWLHDRAAWEAAEHALHPTAAPTAADWLAPPPEFRDEPALAAERHEALDALQTELDAQDPLQRELWEESRAGRRLAALARRLRRALYALVRLRQRLLAALKARLGRKY